MATLLALAALAISPACGGDDDDGGDAGGEELDGGAGAYVELIGADYEIPQARSSRP